MSWRDAPVVEPPQGWRAAPVVEQQEPKQPKPETGYTARNARQFLLSSPLGAVARGVKDVIDTGAEFAARLGGPEEVARVRAMNEAGKAEFQAATQALGAPPSALPAVGRIAGNVAATAPAVTALGGAVAPMLPRLGQAIRTGGMSTGAAPVGLAARSADVGTRIAGGGIGGYVAAGMVDPDSAATGGMIGMAAPPVVQALGKGGQAFGAALRGPSQPPQLAQAVRDARGAGYVIPPTQARPTLGNRILEGFSGKITTAQNASASNQAVTNRLAAEALDLPPNTQITADVLDEVRSEAGKAYAALEALPKRPPVAADTLTNRPAVPGLDPKAAVFDLRKARNDATAWFRSYGRTADPDALAKAQAASSKAQQLEASLEDYAQGLNKPELVQALRDARQRIAKTYTIEGALNPASGSIDARKLAADLQKGKPLSGPLKLAGEFASQFPKAAQPVEGMGSLPQTSPLDWALSGSLSAVTANPLMMAGVAARPMARSAVLSGPVQNRLIQPPPSNTPNALLDPEIQRLILRGAPLLGTDR
jgi:hypothetical protein